MRTQDYCIFHRDGTEFALSTAVAKEVVELRSFTPVPAAAPDLIGAFNLRGEIVPLVRLDPILGVTGRPVHRGDPLLVIGSDDLRFAAAVDQVAAIQHLAPWEIRRDAPTGVFLGASGPTEKPIIVLDAERLVASVLRRIAEGFRSAGSSRGSSPASGSGLESSPASPAPIREDN